MRNFSPDAISNVVGYARFYSRSHPVVIRVFDESGTVIEAHEHAGDFQEPRRKFIDGRE
jgi:hypothetical protein